MNRWRNLSDASRRHCVALVAAVVVLLSVVGPLLVRRCVLESRLARLTSDDPSVRAAVIASLANSDIGREVARLIGLLSDGGDESRRAARALVEIGSPAVIPLTECLRRNADIDVARQASPAPVQYCILEVLGDIADTTAIPAILDVWACCHGSCRDWRPIPESDLALYSAAVSSLSAMGEPAARLMIEESKKIGIVPDLYRDALLDLAYNGILDPVLENVRHPVITEAAVWILACTRGPRAVGPLIALLDGRSSVSRWYVAFALTVIDDDRAREAVDAFARQNDALLRNAVDNLVPLTPGDPSPENKHLRMFLTVRYGPEAYFPSDVREEFAVRYWHANKKDQAAPSE